MLCCTGLENREETLFLQIVAAIATILLVLIIPNLIYLMKKVYKLESRIFWLEHENARVKAGGRLMTLERMIIRIDNLNTVEKIENNVNKILEVINGNRKTNRKFKK